MDDAKTQEIHEWMKSLNDHDKARFAINWNMPHTLFNIACKFKPSEELQNVNWFKIFKSRDIGYWENGNRVNTI